MINILITGGASGLGEAITKLLAKEANNKIYFTYSKSNENALKIASEFTNTVPIKCDFTNTTELDNLTNNLSQYNLDVLINNAYCGTFLKTHFHKIPLLDFSTDFNNNIIPTIQITQAAINGFRKKRQGKIISILTSALVNTPPIGSAVYIANKAYMEKLTKLWAHENVKFNISSNSVSPSLMRTNLTADMDERVLEQIEKEQPNGKMLTIEEVAEAVKFLVSASTQINGLDIIINSATNIK